MSLLLDALQRASKEKEKLADARAAAGEPSQASSQTPQPAPPTLVIDAAQGASLSPANLAPRVELAIEPAAEASAPSLGIDAIPGFPELTIFPPDSADASTPPDFSPDRLDTPAEWALDTAEEPAIHSSPAGEPLHPESSARDYASASVVLQPDAAPMQFGKDVAEPPAVRLEPSVSSRAAGGATEPVRPSGSAHPSPVVSPQVAREILGATAKPAKKGASKRLIAMGVVALLIAAINAAFFLGFLDRFFGNSSSDLMPPVPPPPVTASAPLPIAPGPVAAVEGPAAGDPPTSPDAKTEPLAATAATRVTGGAPRSAARRDDLPTPGEGKPVASAGEAAAKRASRATGAIAKPLFVAKPTALSALDAAYAALTEDRLDEARIAYRQALEKNPGERDALLGLAYIAQRQGNGEEARVHYQNVLRQEPGNASANAGLLAIAADGDLSGAASRAREMADRAPDSAAVLSSLGGILAKEGRIAEAQQAYFKALTLEPDNALHAYNLAVALDRLHKYAQAGSYYRRALALAEKSSAGDRANFPRKEALQRLDQLSATSSDAQVGYAPESRAR